jgi:purine nucleosidase
MKQFSHLLCVVGIGVALALPASAQPRKIIVDQDARGPAGTDIQSILVFLQSPDVEVLGITIVSGDEWVKAETQHALRAVEIAGRTDVPVVPGAEYPLLNSKEESDMWEQQYGEFAFKGIWTRGLYHPPDVVPELPEGAPTTKPLNEHAVNFIIRMVHKYPHEVTLWAGGPLTNFALALRLDPELASLAKEIVLMGPGFNAPNGKGSMTRIDGRREFNWWWDPEAARIVMSAPWKKITITGVDISVKTRLTEDIKAEIAKANTPVAQYLTKFAPPGRPGGYMWDELSAMSVLDPSVITQQQELYVNIDIDHEASYGQTIFMEKELPRSGANLPRKLPSWWKLATVQWDLDAPKFYKMYIDLMTRPTPVKGRSPDR